MDGDMSPSNLLLQQYADMVVPYSFNAGFVCLSYGISLVGTGTTLELIRRRTSHKGLHNLLLLIGAAIAMGGIAIWSMHFIGNRAIYMLNGEEAFQIAYSTSLTIMSLLVPILVLALAFLGVIGSGQIRWWRIILAGLLSGGAICGMHYLGNASISNYSSSYRLSYFIGSIIIAVFASITALTLFFVFESTWSNAWWKRIGCAMVLAGAVSGMHWCAALGTSYRLLNGTPSKGVSRQDAMIVVICLAISAGVVLTGLAIYSSWVRRDYASKSQQVVLAACVFDDKGRIMVSQDGYLPSEVVTDTYLPKSNDDVFNTNHPLFHWMFRASRNWDTINKVMAQMAHHISFLAQERNTGRAGIRLAGEDGVLVEDYDIILRELFCDAADALAAKTRDSLKRVGYLWDDIFVTGESVSKGSRRQRLADKLNLQSLAEKGFAQPVVQEYGRGCLMFLVRRVESKRDMERMEAAGYRFAEVHQVVGTIQSSMHIKTPDLESRLRNMSAQKDKTTLLRPGVHVGMFAVRARLDRGGFDVLAQKTAKNLLPAVSLPIKSLEPAHVAFLRQLSGMTLAAILVKLERQSQFSSIQEEMFAASLREAIAALRDLVGDEAFDDATLLPREVQLPCAAKKRTRSLSACTLISFQLVLPIHNSLLAPRCEFTPLKFFKMRQLTYESSSQQIEFSHMLHRDISSVLFDQSARRRSNRPPVPAKTYSGHSLRTASSTLSLARSQEKLSDVASHSSSLCHGDDASFDDARKPSTPSTVSTYKELERQEHKPNPSKQVHILGGIMVSKEVSINVYDTQKLHSPQESRSEIASVRSADTQGQMENCYTATATGEIKRREAAFVDELLALAVQADKRTTT